MPVLATTHPTLLDLAKRQEPDMKIATVVELLNQTNEVLDDMVWIEGNLPTGHRTTVRTGIPAPTWRKLYGTVQPTKSQTAQVTDNCGMMEAYAEVDKALVDLNGNTAAFRLSEEMATIEGINQELSRTIFYGNEGTLPESFTGLSPRYSTTVGAANAENILKAGGAGSDNGSIWLVCWGPNTVHGIIPKGSRAGLQITDKGQVTIEDLNNNGGGRMEAYRTHYRLDAGLSLRDWRYVFRIANIDKSDLSFVFNAGTFATGANLPDLMYQAMRKIPNLNAGRCAFYMSRDMATAVSRQRAAMGNANYVNADNVRGDLRWAETFHGIPIRRVDSLAADEALVP
jgi:hypothetical protein